MTRKPILLGMTLGIVLITVVFVIVFFENDSQNRGDLGFIDRELSSNDQAELNGLPDLPMETSSREQISSRSSEDNASGWFDDLTDPRSVTGRILESDGRAVPDVRIYLKVDPLDTGPSPEVSDFVTDSMLFVTTSADGAFAVRVRPDFRYHLLAVKSGYLPVLFHAPSGEHRIIIMERSHCAIAGRIIDGTSTSPVVGARVALRYDSGPFETALCTKTDAMGKFVFETAPEFLSSIEVEAENYDPVRLFRLPSRYLGETDIEIFPRAKVALCFIVRDRSHDPIDEVLFSGNRSRADSRGVHLIDQAVDEDEIVVQADNYCRKVLITELMKEGTIYEVELTPSGRCYGHIIDYQGNPVGQVRVSAFFSRSEEIESMSDAVAPAVSSTDGAFILDDVPLGVTFDLRLEKENSFQRVLEGFLADAAGSYIGELVYDFKSSIAGEIVAEGGRPIPGAWVMVEDPNGSLSRAMTDEQGRFELDIDSYKRIFVSRWGFYNYDERYEAGDVVFIPPGKSFHKRIVLKKSGFISGIVRDAQGGPVPGAVIVLRPKEGTGTRGATGTNLTDTTGRFTLRGIDPGKQFYIKAFRHSAPIEYAFGDEDLYRGGDREIVLAVNETCLIHGRIRDGLGNLIRGSRLLQGPRVEVCIEKGIVRDKRRIPGRLSRSGYYAFRLEPGSYSVFVKSRHYEHQTLHVDLAADEVLQADLVLETR